jgi:spastin
MEEFRKWKAQKEKAEKNQKEKEESDDEEKEDEENDNDNDSNEEETFSVDDFPPKVLNKINKKDLRIVFTTIEKCDMKYTEGLDCVNDGDYEFAMDYFKNANSSYLALNKLVQSKTDVYPPEFRNIVSSKITEKIKLVQNEAKKCSKLKKENAQKRNVNQNITNYNYNINYQNNAQNKPQNQKNIHDTEEDEMDKKVESEIMVKNPKVKFSDIIGMQEMKQTLYEIIVVPTIRPDLFTGIRKPQRGILLFGPPGTGKTMIAKAIATECNSTFFNISASSLTSKWVGESEKTVKSLFKIAYKKVPSIIFIDEIDSILSKRSGSENEATKRLKTEFLIQFDGLGSNTNARLLVIAATNRPMDLDEALLRRLPKRVYCGPLDENGRFEFIKKVINRVETNLSDEDIKEIAQKTNDYSNSDLMEMCREAAYQPVRELSMEEILKIKKFRPLVKEDLIKAVQKIRGTLSKKVRDELQKWNEQFGGI